MIFSRWSLSANAAWSAAVAMLLQGGPAPAPLPAPNAALPADFTRVTAVRELADGRVLVVDAGERKLLVADFAKGTATPLGREGQGPGEYRSLGSLYPLANDSTLLVDILGGRWLLLARDSIVQTVGGDTPALRNGARIPAGADARGAVIATRAMGMGGAAPAPTAMPRMDSTHLLRIARATGRADTVADLASRPARIASRGTADRVTAVEITSNPLAAGDVAVLFADGTIAVARVNPYRVDWIAPDGALTKGAPLPFTRLSVTTREREAVLRREAEQNGRAPRPVESVADWPEILPPFLAGAVLPAPDGRLWIRRTPSAADPATRYDVIARTGALASRVSLPPNEHVIGFGRNTVYTVQTDPDGLQHLRRHSRTPNP